MAQYYVKNGGIDSKTGLSDADAWGTIGKVNSINFDDNDIISFKRGSTFADEILTLDSTSAGRSGITIQDYGYGNKPLFSGNTVRPVKIDHALVKLTIKNIDISGQSRLDTTHHNMYIKYVKGLILDGIEGNGHYNYNGIAEGRQPIAIDRCSGIIEVINCNLHDWGPSLIPSVGTDYNAITINNHDYGTFFIHNNLIYNIQSSAICRFNSLAQAYINNNIIYNCGQSFVRIGGSKNIDIFDNHAYREPDFTGPGGADGGDYPFIKIYTNDGEGNTKLTQNIIIKDNILGPTDGQGIHLNGNNEIDKVDNITIKNNEIINCTAGFVTGTYVTNVDCYKNIVRGSTWVHIFDWGGRSNQNVNFFNNTFYSTNLSRSIYFQYGGLNIYNNIFYDSAYMYMIDLQSGDPLIYNNLWYNPSSSDYINWKGTIFTSSQQTAWRDAGHSGAIFANPKFIDAENGDFRLQPDSPAIDTGVDVGLPFIGTAIDIGAFEYTLYDPCEGVVCDNICVGKDLWSQKCDPATGNCVTDQLLEINASICGYDLCEGVVCDNICVGKDLWSQKCDPATGNCVTDQLLESNSVTCSFDPCEGVICENICIGENLWSQKCDQATGNCVTDQLLESNSVTCGYDPCVDVVCSSICIGDDLWSQRCDPETGNCVLNQLVQQDSDLCIQNLCEGVFCDDICIGDDLWSQRCDPETGNCVLNQLVQQDSINCIIPDQVPSDESTIQTYIILGGFGLMGLAMLILRKKK